MFGITEDMRRIEGAEYAQYRVVKVLSTPLHTVPFNWGYGSNLHEYVDALNDARAHNKIKNEIYRVFKDKSNSLADLELKEVVIKKDLSSLEIEVDFLANGDFLKVRI